MEKYINDSENESSKVFQILELCDCPDEKLLKEFEAASQLDDSVIPHGPDGEADIIWINENKFVLLVESSLLHRMKSTVA